MSGVGYNSAPKLRCSEDVEALWRPRRPSMGLMWPGVGGLGFRDLGL